MADIYWNPTSGNDSNTGASPEQAFLTMSKCLTVVAAGGTIRLTNGTHVLAASFREYLYTANHSSLIFSSESDDASLAILDGDSLYKPALENYGNSGGDGNATFRNITFKNIPHIASGYGIYYAHKADSVTRFENCVFDGCALGGSGLPMIWVEGSGATAVIESCLFANNTSQVTQSLLGHRTSVAAVELSIINSILYLPNPIASGIIQLDGGSNGVANLINSIVYTDGISYLLESYSTGNTLNADHSCYYRVGAGGTIDYWNGSSEPTIVDTDSISEDPLFIYPEGGYFDLAPNSPCINAGTIV